MKILGPSLRKICARWPISRVLSLSRSSLDDHSSGMRIAAHLDATDPDDGAETHLSTGPKSLERPSLFGLAPGGVYPAAAVTSRAVRSYRTFSPLPAEAGGLFSVALSLGLPPPDVIRHLASVEPGLSSACESKQRPSSHLARTENGRAPGPGQARGQAGNNLF